MGIIVALVIGVSLGAVGMYLKKTDISDILDDEEQRIIYFYRHGRAKVVSREGKTIANFKKISHKDY